MFEVLECLLSRQYLTMVAHIFVCSAWCFAHGVTWCAVFEVSECLLCRQYLTTVVRIFLCSAWCFAFGGIRVYTAQQAVSDHGCLYSFCALYGVLLLEQLV